MSIKAHSQTPRLRAQNRRKDAQKFTEELLGGPPTFGELMTAMRECEELSQKDFAKRLKITPQQLNDIEKNRKIVSPELAAKYAKVLGQSEAQFIRLALEAKLRKSKLNYTVELRLAG